ncbi:MAG: class I SAM-dependent methyltransferase [Armatimonadota bacterium]
MDFPYNYDAGFDDPNNKNAWFVRGMGTGKSVLEVGCATGYVGEYLANQLDCRVWGIEYIKSAAEQSRARNCYEDVIIGDIQDPHTVTPLQPGSFDYILFGDVLEHLNQPEKALEIVTPLLKPEGHILICVPSIVHWSIRMRVLKGQFEYTETGPLDRTHVRFFTPKSARDLMAATNLRIVRQGGVVWLPSVVYKLSKSLRYRLERAAGAAFPNLMYGQVLLDAVPLSQPSPVSASPIK